MKIRMITEAWVLILVLGLSVAVCRGEHPSDSEFVGLWSFDLFAGDMKGKEGWNPADTILMHINPSARLVPGIVGRAFEFNGDEPGSSLINMPPAPDTADDITLMGWIKLGDRQNMGMAGIVQLRNNGRLTVYDTRPPYSIRFDFIDPCKQWHILQSKRLLDAGQWHHVAATYEKKSGEMKLFIDGLLVKKEDGGKEGRAPLAYRPVEFMVGALDEKRVLRGALDEVKIIGRALDTNEIFRIYETERSGKSYYQQSGDATNALHLVPAVYFDNMIYNGGFEAWSNPDLPDGWGMTPSLAEGSEDVCLPDKAEKWEGARSMRIRVDKEPVTIDTGALLPAYQTGRIYIFSLYAKADHDGKVQISVRRGKDGSKTFNVGKTWTRLPLVTEIAAGNNKNVRFSITLISNGVFWLDAVKCEELAGYSTAPWLGPCDLRRSDLRELSAAPPQPEEGGRLGGIGPRLSYYTTENEAEFVFDVAADSPASLALSVLDPAGSVVGFDSIEERGRIVLSIPIAKLPAGTYRAVGELRDGKGKTLDRKEFPLLKAPPLPGGSEIKIDRMARCFLRNGAPYLPIGAQITASAHCNDTNKLNQWLATVLPPQMDAHERMGYNTVMVWSGFWSWETKPDGKKEVTFQPEAMTRLLNEAHQRGMTVACGLEPLWAPAPGQKLSDERLEWLKETVRQFKSHPALFSWYLSDEPDPGRVRPADLGRVYLAVKEADPYHPLVVNGYSLDNLIAYHKASDIDAVDVYPVPYGPAGTVALVCKRMSGLTETRPVMFWVDAFGCYGYKWREPTATEIKSMTYQALVFDTRWILYFALHDKWQRLYSLAATKGLAETVSEVKELAPALCAPKPAVDTQVEPEDCGVKAVLRKTSGRCFIIAVNLRPKPVEAQLLFPPDSIPSKSVEVLFENRKATIRNGRICDRFEPLARHVYSWPAP